MIHLTIIVGLALMCNLCLKWIEEIFTVKNTVVIWSNDDEVFKKTSEVLIKEGWTLKHTRKPKFLNKIGFSKYKGIFIKR